MKTSSLLPTCRPSVSACVAFASHSIAAKWEFLRPPPVELGFSLLSPLPFAFSGSFLPLFPPLLLAWPRSVLELLLPEFAPRFPRMLVMWMGVPVMALRATATRTSWPPPSRVVPSRWMGFFLKELRFEVEEEGGERGGFRG